MQKLTHLSLAIAIHLVLSFFFRFQHSGHHGFSIIIHYIAIIVKLLWQLSLALALNVMALAVDTVDNIPGKNAPF